MLTSNLLGHLGDEADDLGDDDQSGDEDGEGRKPQARKPHLQGRFSGRLETKDDEKRLADECRLLGPLLGGTGKRGERCRLTLAKIVRGIASGEVRRYCEGRERLLRELKLLTEQHEQRIKHSQQAQTEAHAMRAEAEQQNLQVMHATLLDQDSNMQNPGLTILSGTVTLPMANAGAAMLSSGQNMAGSASEPVAVMAPGHLTMANGLLTNGMSANGLAPLQNQPHSLLSAPQLETTFAPRPPLAPAMPTVVLPSEDQPPSEMLKAQAETLKLHADIVASNSQSEASQPAKVQAHVKAQSLQAHANATVNASKLAQHSSMGSNDSNDAQDCSAQAAQTLSRQAHQLEEQAVVVGSTIGTHEAFPQGLPLQNGLTHYPQMISRSDPENSQASMTFQASPRFSNASLQLAGSISHHLDHSAQDPSGLGLQQQPTVLQQQPLGLQQQQQPMGLQQHHSGLQQHHSGLQHQNSGLQQLQQPMGLQQQHSGLQQRTSGPSCLSGIQREGSMTKFGNNSMRRTASAQPTLPNSGSSSKRIKYDDLAERQMQAQGLMPLQMPSSSHLQIPQLVSSHTMDSPIPMPISLQTDAFGTMINL
ncbi:hypothetical protein WJX84_011865 [Apatococcus fuscideae]|uniref:Uncharacterized protein n=1 Tax=Apatococcus fuscideae TaxID=2026836 RepID=A0AAW1TE72_9CHLO